MLLEIKELRRTRALQRASRKRRGGSHGQDMQTVAIVGYTNAVCLFHKQAKIMFIVLLMRLIT